MDPFLIEPDCLADRLNRQDVAVLDCAWFAPESGKRGIDEYRRGHIPGARHFDLERVSDPGSPYPNMMPTADRFAEAAGSEGIDRETTVVIYDASYVSARIWWMFRRFGHAKVAVLDGGLRRWKAAGRPLDVGDAAPAARKIFEADVPAVDIAGWQDVLDALNIGTAQVVDARARERFTGALPSGYPGLRGGHMPGAVNVPWTTMIDQDGEFRFVSPENAEQVFRDAGLDPDRPIISTCGSGVTAAVLTFQLLRMGKKTWKIYDGSWNEWGRLM